MKLELAAAIRATMANKKEYFSDAYLANQIESNEPERYQLDERLSSLAQEEKSVDIYESKMLELYSHITELVVNAASNGLNRCQINVNIDKAGQVGQIIGPRGCAKAMAHLLRTEGLETSLVHGGLVIDVRWPKKPPHWDNRN